MKNAKKCQKTSKMLNYVIFYIPSIKNFQFLTVFDNFYFTVKSKMAPKMVAILDDVTGRQQRGNP